MVDWRNELHGNSRSLLQYDLYPAGLCRIKHFRQARFGTRTQLPCLHCLSTSHCRSHLGSYCLCSWKVTNHSLCACFRCRFWWRSLYLRCLGLRSIRMYTMLALITPPRLLQALWAVSSLLLPSFWQCISKKGPVFAAMFCPLLLIIVGLFSAFFFAERLHLGSFIGALIIVLGLYVVLWGKSKDTEEDTEEDKKDNCKVRRTQQKSSEQLPSSNSDCDPVWCENDALQ